MKLNFTIIIKNLFKHIFIIPKYKNISDGNEENIPQCKQLNSNKLWNMLCNKNISNGNKENIQQYEQLNCNKLEMNLKNMPLNDFDFY